MDDVRVFGECECCGEDVTDEQREYFVDSEGRVFCSIECVCDKYGLTKVEL